MRRPLAFLAALLVAMPALAAEIVPRPRPKPDRPVTRDAEVPIPRDNPRRTSVAPSPAPPSGSADGTCLKGLGNDEVEFKPLAPIDDGGCGAAAPLLVSKVAGVALEPPATLTCDMTRSLAAWVGTIVQPAARQRLKTDVTAIRVAASYVCRRRNNLGSGKLSEHAKANALDMAGFRFAKAKDVTVGDGWGSLAAAVGLSRNDSFLSDIRTGACAHFTTVLGPGSDPYHGDHFHVDALVRRGGYRICQ